MQVHARERRSKAAVLLTHAFGIDHEQGRTVARHQMLNRLSGERVLLRIELHALADTQLQGIIAHAAGALQAIENRRPSLVRWQALYENFDAANPIQGP